MALLSVETALAAWCMLILNALTVSGSCGSCGCGCGSAITLTGTTGQHFLDLCETSKGQLSCMLQNDENGQWECSISKTHSEPKPPPVHGNLCKPNPCGNGGICSEAINDFRCQCPFPMGGKTCQDLACGDASCFRMSNYVVLVYNKASVKDYQTAKHDCESKGMQMAMPKTREKWGFIRKNLVGLHKANRESQELYLIGLNRKTGTADFEWADGDILLSTDFQPWSAPPGALLCVNMANPTKWDFKWTNYNCESSAYVGWKGVYYMCEKSIANTSNVCDCNCNIQ